MMDIENSFTRNYSMFVNKPYDDLKSVIMVSKSLNWVSFHSYIFLNLRKENLHTIDLDNI